MSLFSRSRFVLLGLFFLAVTSVGHAAIYEAKNLDELRKYTSSLNSQDLAIFEFDITLIQPADPSFHFSNIERYIDWWQDTVFELDQDELDILGTLIYAKEPWMLISEQAVALLGEMKKKRVKTLGISSDLPGKLGDISSVEDNVAQKLKGLGIDFSQLFGSSCEIAFTEFPSFRGNFPLLKNGILFVNGTASERRADMIISLLKRVNFYPKTVLLVGLDRDLMEATEELLKDKFPKINFVGVCYAGVAEFLSPFVDEMTFKEKWQFYIDQAQIIE